MYKLTDRQNDYSISCCECTPRDNIYCIKFMYVQEVLINLINFLYYPSGEGGSTTVSNSGDKDKKQVEFNIEKVYLGIRAIHYKKTAVASQTSQYRKLIIFTNNSLHC